VFWGRCAAQGQWMQQEPDRMIQHTKMDSHRAQSVTAPVWLLGREEATNLQGWNKQGTQQIQDKISRHYIQL